MPGIHSKVVSRDVMCDDKMHDQRRNKYYVFINPVMRYRNHRPTAYTTGI